MTRWLDFDAHRKYVLFYGLVLLCGVAYLYLPFFLSDGMLGGGDMLVTGVFFRSFLVEHVKEFGSVPQWNPFMFCGLPYVDAFHGDVFYPLSFLKYLGTVYRMLGATLILHVYLAGVFMYLAARRLGLSKLGATMAGMSYAFSGWLNGLVVPGHDGKMFVTALFPLTIFFLDRAFAKDRFLNFTMLGLTIGVIILTPHPQLAYYTLWTLCAYTVYKLITLFITTRRVAACVIPGLLAVYAVVVGLLLSSIQMLPGYEYTKEWSVRADVENRYEFAASFSLHPEEAVSMIVPEFCGRDRLWEGVKRYWGQNSFKDNSEYVGLVPLILSIVGIVYGRGRGRYFFTLLAATAFLYSMGDHTPFFRLCYKIVPLVESTRAPSTITFLFSFAVSVLAGMGVEALWNRNRGSRWNFHLPLKILYFGLLGLLLAGAVAYTYAPEEAHRLYLRLVTPQFLGNEGKLALARNNFTVMGSGFKMACALTAIFGLMIGLSHRRRVGPIMIVLLPALAMADGIRYNGEHILIEDAASHFSLSPVIEYVRDHVGPYRACGFEINELNLQPYLYGVKSTIGYHGNQLRSYIDVLRDRGPYTVNYRRPRFANLAGVKYIICPTDISLDTMGYAGDSIEKSAEFDSLAVFENKACFPRVYLAGRYRVFSSMDSLCFSIYDSDDDLRQVVYLSREPGGVVDSTNHPGDTAFIAHYGVDSIDIRAACSTGKILTFSDNYYKDWRVFVDGKGKDPMITYGTFRGVILEPGQHTVVWKYIPSTYHTGRMITAGTAVYILVVVTGYGIVRRGRRRTGCASPNMER